MSFFYLQSLLLSPLPRHKQAHMDITSLGIYKVTAILSLYKSTLWKLFKVVKKRVDHKNMNFVVASCPLLSLKKLVPKPSPDERAPAALNNPTSEQKNETSS